MVTLAGLEPATSPAPQNKDALSPLSYSVVTIFMTVCGGAGAEGKDQPPTTEQGDALSPLPAALVRRGIGRLFCRPRLQRSGARLCLYEDELGSPHRLFV